MEQKQNYSVEFFQSRANKRVMLVWTIVCVVLSGAYAMAVSDGAYEKCVSLAANMTYLELSACPGYMDSFVAACFIPHTDRSLFPNSAQEG